MSAPSQRVLLAEDDDQVRKLVAMLFSCLGCDVIQATDGIEAVNIARSHDSLRLAIIDSDMPNMDGLTAVRLIRDLRPTLPIVLCSGSRYALANVPGATDLLPKPFGIDAARALLIRHGCSPAL
jgi:two-component system chemotaxis response regulator CheY